MQSCYDCSDKNEPYNPLSKPNAGNLPQLASEKVPKNLQATDLLSGLAKVAHAFFLVSG